MRQATDRCHWRPGSNLRSVKMPRAHESFQNDAASNPRHSRPRIPQTRTTGPAGATRDPRPPSKMLLVSRSPAPWRPCAYTDASATLLSGAAIRRDAYRVNPLVPRRPPAGSLRPPNRVIAFVVDRLERRRVLREQRTRQIALTLVSPMPRSGSRRGGPVALDPLTGVVGRSLLWRRDAGSDARYATLARPRCVRHLAAE
jgi:hypothetical protein